MRWAGGNQLVIAAAVWDPEFAALFPTSWRAFARVLVALLAATGVPRVIVEKQLLPFLVDRMSAPWRPREQ